MTVGEVVTGGEVVAGGLDVAGGDVVAGGLVVAGVVAGGRHVTCTEAMHLDEHSTGEARSDVPYCKSNSLTWELSQHKTYSFKGDASLKSSSGQEIS